MKYILNNSYCENFEKFSKAFLQKEPPEVFYKKRYSYRFCKIHKKAPVPGVPESLYTPATLLRLRYSCFQINLQNS